MTETQYHPEEEAREVAQVDSSLAVARSRVELDQQVATARAYPRSIKKFQQQCMEMATLNEQVAEECFYALPRKENGETKMIEGPSARLAEIVASSWGNCRAGARVVDEGAEFITAQGVFHDIERNVNITMEVRRRITGRSGRRYSSDMIAVTGNAACSIALRNAVFRGVPKALWSGIYEAARMAAVGDVQTLANKRSAMFAHFQKLGVQREAILTTIGVAGEEDIDLDKLATLKGIASAIKDGEITPEQAFAPPAAASASAAPAADGKGVAGLAARAAATKAGLKPIPAGATEVIPTDAHPGDTPAERVSKAIRGAAGAEAPQREPGEEG